VSPVTSEPIKESTLSKYETAETSTTKAASGAPFSEDKQIADAQTGNAVESDIDAIQLTETIAVSSTKATKRRTSDAVSKKEAVPAASDEQEEKRTTTTNSIMDEAMALYYKGEYGQALLLFKKAPKTSTSSYYAGICSFNLGDFDDSRRQFQSAINQVDAKSSVNPIESNLQESSYWHLGLCLVKLGKTQEARNALQTVVRLNGEHKTSAEKLLKEL
jgi:TolA-binding protein